MRIVADFSFSSPMRSVSDLLTAQPSDSEECSSFSFIDPWFVPKSLAKLRPICPACPHPMSDISIPMDQGALCNWISHSSLLACPAAFKLFRSWDRVSNPVKKKGGERATTSRSEVSFVKRRTWWCSVSRLTRESALYNSFALFSNSDCRSDSKTSMIFVLFKKWLGK